MGDKEPTETITSIFTTTLAVPTAISDTTAGTVITTNIVSQTVDYYVYKDGHTSTSYDALIVPNAGESTGGDSQSTTDPATTAPPVPGTTTSTSTPGSSVTPGSGSGSPSSTPSATGSPSSSSPSGISSGAAAGIGVGCAVAGLLIGLLAACLFLRRRKPTPKQMPPAQDYQAIPYNVGEKGVASGAGAGAGAGAGMGIGMGAYAAQSKTQLDQYLLDAKSDSEITRELSSLNQLIQQHVDNHYHTRPVQRDAQTLTEALVGLGLQTDQGASATPAALSAMARDPKTRWAALQHIISRVAFNSTTLNGNTPVSLLPPSVAAFARSVPPVEPHRGSSTAVESALMRWRQLSAFLLHPNRSERTPLLPSEDVSTQEAQHLAVALNSFLESFIAGGMEERYEQENHLREVLVECAGLGYTLFSQPCEYRFNFQGFPLVVSPGLDRVTDERGQRLPSPQTLVAPTTPNM